MIEGKTKLASELFEHSNIGVFTNKDAITAKDGKKQHTLPGKGALVTRTTCNVFDYLARKGHPLAYIGRDGPDTFLAQLCDMIPVEVVVRGVATGSYLGRHPEVEDGTVFTEPVVEFNLKTTDGKFQGWHLYHPHVRDTYLGPLGQLSPEESRQLAEHLETCTPIAVDAFLDLASGWEYIGGTLYDIKFEFGITAEGDIVIADELSGDSWRVMWFGFKLSKQGYRDGDDLMRVSGIYRITAALTDRLAAVP